MSVGYTSSKLTFSLGQDLDHLRLDRLAVSRNVTTRIVQGDQNALSARTELEGPGLLVIVLGNQPLFRLILERLEVSGGQGKQLVDEEVEGGENELRSKDWSQLTRTQTNILPGWSTARMGRMSLNRSMPRSRKRFG